MFRRTGDNRDVIAALEVPLLLCHGTADEVILPAMAEELGRVADEAWKARIEERFVRAATG